MKLETFRYSPESGWSVETFPTLDSERTLVIAFGASDYLDEPAPLRELAAAYPRSLVTGCSSAGEIFGTEILDGSISVAVLRFEDGQVRQAFAEVSVQAESFQAGRRLAEELVADDIRAVLVFSDGVRVNGSELVRGLNSVLASGVVVTGGLAGDGDRFARTWVLHEGRPVGGGVTAVGLYGASPRVAHGSKGGFDPFGPRRKVTRSEGNVLLEVDGEPVLPLYQNYLGERASGLPATGLLFPLAVWPEPDEDKMLVRTTQSIDEENLSITYFGDIPEGATVQFMRANFDRLVEGAHAAAEMARGGADGAPVLSITVSCVGRRIILGQRTEEETEAILEELPAGSRQIGFYSYGEISPHAGGHCDLHNQTMTLTTIGEA